jgi:hypothetical protein
MNNELELSVKKLELGTLTTNAIAVRDKVKDLLSNYKSENYNEGNIDKAKEDKALLNNTSKKLNDERIRLEKEFMKPFNEFKDIVTETTTMIKEASSKIDEIVKEVESRAREERKGVVTTLFNDIVGELKDLITLDMVFDEKWLNKGSFNDKGEFKLSKELEDKLNRIRQDLEAIKNLKSEHELALTNQYLKDFNLGNVIIENNRLNELKTNTQKVGVAKEEIKEAKVEEMITTPVTTEEIDPIKTYTLKITAELSKQKKLKEFLKLNGMKTINVETGEVIID